MSQATDSLFLSQDSSQALIDREDMEKYMGPAAIDGFVGNGNEVVEDTSELDEQEGRFTIPLELLMQMPIANVTEDTRIIPLRKVRANTSTEANVGDGIEPQAGTSGVKAPANANEMDTQDTITDPPVPNNTVPIPEKSVVKSNNPVTNAMKKTPNPTANLPNPKMALAAPNPQKPPGNIVRSGNVPKKGYNTKNRKVHQAEIEIPENDNGVQRRMELLGEIADIVRKSAEKRNMTELDVWGHYMGLKVARVQEGRRRDKVLVKVEELVNDAIHDDMDMEE